MGNSTEVTTIALAGAIVTVLLNLFGPLIERLTGGPVSMEFGAALTTIVSCVLGLVLPADLAARVRRNGNGGGGAAAIALVALLGLSGCTGLGAHRDAGARCYELADSYRVWGAIAVAAATVSGSSAVATSIPDERDPRLVFGVSTAAVAAVGAAAIFVRDDVLSEWETLACDGTETSTVTE